MSASRIMYDEDSSDDDGFSHTDDELIESDGSEQMESNNRCDDGDKSAKERVCPHCNIAFNDATALQKHLYEIIAENTKKGNIDGTVRASIGKTRSKPSANVQNDGGSIVSEEKMSEDSDGQDSGSKDLDSSFSVRNSNIVVMYECLICHTRLPSKYYANKHKRNEHPGPPGSRFFKTVYMKEYVPKVKETKSKIAASRTKRSRGISINKIHIENMNLSDLPAAVETRPKSKDQNTKDKTKKVMKTINTDTPKIDKTPENSKGSQKNNMESKRKSEDRDTSSGKARRTQNGEESSVQVLYQCNLCEVFFVSQKTASTHLKSCRNGVPIEPVNCGKCGRPFEHNELVTHSVRDHRHSEMQPKIVQISPVPERQTPKGTPEKKQGNSSKQDKVPLFKCQECDAHFVTPDGLRMHKHRNRHDMELIQCEICDFSFTTSSHNAHIIEHHDRLGLRRRDFEVVANNVPDPSRSRRTKDTASESDSSDITEKETSESDQDWSPKKKDSELPPVMKTLQKPKTKSYTKKMGTTHPVARATTTKYGPSEDVLYKCGEKRCGLFFTTSRGLKEHVSKELHEADLKLQCKFCKNYFSQNSLSYHLKHHHIEKRDDIDDNVSIFSLDISNFITKVKDKRTIQKRNVYKCSTCNVHFVQQNTLETHMKVGSHKIAKRQVCRICGLTFTTHSLTKHIKVHHDEMKLSREDIIVKEYDVIKRASPIKTNVRRDSARQDQKIAQTHTDKIIPIVAEPEAIPSTSSQNSTVVPTLFKCEPCDVHFTEYSACLSHIVNHEPFDRLQFLKCPECELQYENTCLLRHRVVHRGVFDLEQVLVKAYVPRENNVDILKVETYYAARKTATAIHNREERAGNTACKNSSTVLQTEPTIRYEETVKLVTGQTITEVQVHQANDSSNFGGEMIPESVIDEPASESITNVTTTSNNSININNVNARVVNFNEICTEAQNLPSETDTISSATSACLGSDNMTILYIYNIQASAEERSESIARTSDININNVESIPEAYYYGLENDIHLVERERWSPNSEDGVKSDEMELRYEDSEPEDNNEDRLVTEPVSHAESEKGVASETYDPAMVSNNSEMPGKTFINAFNRRYRLSLTGTSDSDFTEDEEVFRNCPTPVLETRHEENDADLNREMSYSPNNNPNNASADINPNHNSIINHENAKECHNTNETEPQGDSATEAMETDNNSSVTENNDGEFVAAVASESQIKDEFAIHIVRNKQSANDSAIQDIIIISDDDNDNDDDDVIFVSSEMPTIELDSDSDTAEEQEQPRRTHIDQMPASLDRDNTNTAKEVKKEQTPTSIIQVMVKVEKEVQNGLANLKIERE